MKIDLLIDLKDFSPETVLFAGLALGIILATPAGFFICAIFSNARANRAYRCGRTDMEKLIRDRVLVDTRGGDFYDHMAVADYEPAWVPLDNAQDAFTGAFVKKSPEPLVFEHGTAQTRR